MSFSDKYSLKTFITYRVYKQNGNGYTLYSGMLTSIFFVATDSQNQLEMHFTSGELQQNAANSWLCETKAACYLSTTNHFKRRLLLFPLSCKSY